MIRFPGSQTPATDFFNGLVGAAYSPRTTAWNTGEAAAEANYNSEVDTAEAAWDSTESAAWSTYLAIESAARATWQSLVSTAQSAYDATVAFAD